MDEIFRGVRKGDVLLAVVLTALGALLMWGNIAQPDQELRIDSDSWAMVPVFALATLPILWRRRGMVPVLAVSMVAMAAHVLLFGWAVRCGAALPLSFAMAYGVGRLSRGTERLVGTGLVVGLQVLALVRDSAAGLEIAPVTALIALAFVGVGVFVSTRSATAEAPASDARVPPGV